MSHNRRTLQDEGFFVLKRQPKLLNGGTSVRKGSAATPAINAEIRLHAERFVVESTHSASVVEPNLPQLMRNNKTVGLVAWEGPDVDGN
jgi:hypothetical protein